MLCLCVLLQAAYGPTSISLHDRLPSICFSVNGCLGLTSRFQSSTPLMVALLRVGHQRSKARICGIQETRLHSECFLLNDNDSSHSFILSSHPTSKSFVPSFLFSHRYITRGPPPHPSTQHLPYMLYPLPMKGRVGSWAPLLGRFWKGGNPIPLRQSAHQRHTSKAGNMSNKSCELFRD